MHERLTSGPTVPELALVQAASLQQRRAGYADGIAAAIEAIRPDERGALTFARDCDRQYSAADAVLRQARRSKLPLLRSRRAIFGAVIGRRLLWFVAAVAFPACGAGIAAAVDALTGLPDSVTVGAGEALTALGILVAVHVLSAELAADRLAGPIAAVTSFPLPLAAGYLAGLALVTRSILTVDKQHTATASAVTIGLVAALILLVLAALVTLLHRTDPVRAVDAFARRRRAVTMRAGRELGELHKQALKARELVQGLPWMRQALDVPRGERRTPIRASRRGYLILRRRRLSRLARRDVWRTEQARAVLVASIGLTVGADEEVFSVIPAVDASLQEGEVRRLARVISVQRHRRVDAVAEATGVLLGVSATQAALGNQAGAEEIAERALGLLDVHLTGIRAARGPVDEDESVGMIPALRTAAVQALRLHAAAADANSREVLLGFLQRLLELTDAADGFPATLAFQLGMQKPDLARPYVRQLLWDCGCRALETDDTASRRAVGEQIARRLGTERDAIELSGHLVQFATATQPQVAEREWARHVALAAQDRQGLELTGVRAGATALWLGDSSLAMTVALELRDLDVPAWRTHFEDRQVADSETLNSELYGQLLGSDPQRALQDFVDFTGRITDAVPAPAGSAAGQV
jgi:hypothetical protein